MILALILSSHLAFADLPKPGSPDDPTSPTRGVALDVRHEGMYSVTVQCVGECNTDLAHQLNRLSIVDTHSDFGVWVTLAATNPASVIDGFYEAVVGADGVSLTAEPRPGEESRRFAYLNFTIDPVTGVVSGTADDFASTGHYLIHGVPLHRLGDLLTGSQMTGMSSDTLIARFHGALNGINGTLLVNKSPTGHLFAHFGSDDGAFGKSSFELSFNGGAWNPATGLLQLVFENPRFFAEGELALVVRADGSLLGIYVNGFVSSSGSFVRLS